MLSLSLEHGRVTAVGALALGTALSVNATLKTLDLSANALGDAGAAALAAEGLASNGSLTSLLLAATSIADEGCLAIAKALSPEERASGLAPSALHALDVSCNRVSAPGASALAAVRGLRLLELGANELRDEGAAAVARDISELAALAGRLVPG